MKAPFSRRSFLKHSLSIGSGLTLAGQLPAQPFDPGPRPAPPAIAMPPLEKVRVGFVGVGDRGTYLLKQLLGLEGVEVRAVCDLEAEKVKRAQQIVEDKGQKRPTGYSKGDMDYRNLVTQHDLDLVINATPWQMHTPVNVAALRAGKHVATEVPAALTLEECWQQVEAAEQAGKHCVILENYCYQRDVMMVSNMVRQGLFGEVMHAEGGYQKDARYYDNYPSLSYWRCLKIFCS